MPSSPEMTIGLDPREKTLGDVLHARRLSLRHGRQVGHGPGQALPAAARGFDFFYGHGNNGIDYYTHERYGVHSMFAGNERTKADKGTYATDLFRREALAVYSQDTSPQASERPQPWFLYLCFNAPHGASSFGADEKNPKSRSGVQAPEEYVAKYADAKLSENLKRYYAAVTCMDDAIGEMLGADQASGEEQNTLVIFQSDNGGSGNGGNAPLRGAKRARCGKAACACPSSPAGRRKIPAGRVSDEFLTTLELHADVSGGCGAQTPKRACSTATTCCRRWPAKRPRREPKCSGNSAAKKPRGWATTNGSRQSRAGDCMIFPTTSAKKQT